MGSAASARTVVSKPVAAYDAEDLQRLTPDTLARVERDAPIRLPENDAFARAVGLIGSINDASSNTNIATWHLLEIIFGGVAPEALDCYDVERECKRQVTCDEMRPDLIWFRDEAGEVVGYAERIEATRLDLEAAIAGHSTRATAGTTKSATTTAANSQQDDVRTVEAVLGGLFGEHKNQFWWNNVALTEASAAELATANVETIQAISNGCENILYVVERGVASSNRLLWAAMQSGYADEKEIGDVTYFLGHIGNYAVELRALKCAMEYQLQKRAA